MEFLTINDKVHEMDGFTAEKTDECNISVDKRIIAKTLTDLNADCLMEIFTYLTLDDLVNVAEAYSQVNDNLSNRK